MLETIQQSAISHDRHQVELKLDYQLDRGKHTHYQISTYIFVPRSLGITEESYPKTELYRDIKNYIRIKTPQMSLRDLIEDDLSPLKIVQQVIHQPGWYLKEAQNEQIIHALRLLGAMFKSSLREHINLVERRVRLAAPGQNLQPLVGNLIDEMIVESEKIGAQYRLLYAEFNMPYVQKDVFLAHLLVDEYISLLIEESATEFFKIVSERYEGTDHLHYCQRLNDIVERETSHRKARGYDSVLKVGDDNEVYAFRSSVIKKYVSGVLHLSVDSQREGKAMEQVLLALAAGISMFFATAVAFHFQSVYGTFTFPAFVALIVGYMFKDRIKQLGQTLFAGKLQANLFDRRVNIRTLDGRYKLATLREKITFMKESDISAEVRSARQKDPFADLDNDQKGETVICHTKAIVLNAELFRRAFAGLPKTSGLNDIIRYDIYRYLRKMDDPVDENLLLRDGKLEVVPSQKVYHINVVSQYSSKSFGNQKIHKRMRLILSRLGIKRIVHIHL
ncbi:MAG: hypothetical protein JNJ96_09100 [Anaerolineales bacterium]|nr:hypothetical protein [Anaerolineales bacterium]HNQ93421.1 hypothetical protein [Anaerolineales bacterium]